MNVENVNIGNVIEVKSDMLPTKVGIVIQSDIGNGLKKYILYFGKYTNDGVFISHKGFDDIEVIFEYGKFNYSIEKLYEGASLNTHGLFTTHAKKVNV